MAASMCDEPTEYIGTLAELQAAIQIGIDELDAVSERCSTSSAISLNSDPLTRRGPEVKAAFTLTNQHDPAAP